MVINYIVKIADNYKNPDYELTGLEKDFYTKLPENLFPPGYNLSNFLPSRLSGLH